MRQELARLEIGYRIGRMLVLREVLGQAPQRFSAATKVFCTEFEQRRRRVLRAGRWDRGRRCSTRVGISPSRVARGVCYAPAYTIMGGTTQILRNIVGERMLGLPR